MNCKQPFKEMLAVEPRQRKSSSYSGLLAHSGWHIDQMQSFQRGVFSLSLFVPLSLSVTNGTNSFHYSSQSKKIFSLLARALKLEVKFTHC